MLGDGHDIPVERDGRGRIARVGVAAFDHHRGQYTNPAKRAAEPAPEDAPEPAPPSRAPNSFEEARRQNEWLKLDTAKIEHQQRIGQLTRADRLEESAERCGREIQAIIARLPNRADELALAVSKEGAHGLRVALRQIAFEFNSEIADALADLAGKAPALDTPIASDDPAKSPADQA